jgi:uncharacterized protein YllA (UPF0747 family)
MNRFVLDWLGGDERFLPRRGAAGSVGPAPPPAGAAGSVGPAPSPASAAEGGGATARAATARRALVDALTASNHAWGHDVGDELHRWGAGETAAIVAGQQVGFAGGPLYTMAKLATLLKMKRDSPKPATAFFWLATEDHDYGEVAQLALPRRERKSGEQDLVYLRAVRHGEVRAVVGPQPVPEPLIEELLALLDMPRPKWLRPKITFRDSVAELMAEAVSEKVVFIDALLPELRRAGAPLFEALVAKWDDVQRALGDRSRALREAGYTPQVETRDGEDFTLLFTIDDYGNRNAMKSPQLIDDPTRISTSALTRPLLQDFVLRPEVFVGGPAEVAYYAQIAPLYELLGVDMPRVALRGHALVAPRRVFRAFDRYGVRPEEVFAGADAIAARREPASVAEVRAVAEKAQKDLAAAMTKIGEIALPAEHALARAVNRSIGHIEYHFGKLTERAIRGLARKDAERAAALRELVATLYPDHHVQDRVVAWLPLWCEHGRAFVDALVDHIEPDSNVCSIVSV